MSSRTRRWTRVCPLTKILLIFFISAQVFTVINGCQFFPVGEYLRFIRVPENLRVGDKVVTLEIHSKHNLTLESIDKGDDAKFFAINEKESNKVDLVLARSLDNFVDQDSPQNIMKFRLVCFPDGADKTPSFLQFTIYIEDINDSTPKFLHAPYFVTVEELTPVGLTVFRGIDAVDLDKPNTANSDVVFSIVEGNEDGKFALESSHNPALIVKKNLDYDQGDHEFKLKIMASDRGNPPLASYTYVTVRVVDNDDLPVAFTKSLYRTQIKEFYPFNNASIHQEVAFPTPIRAFDQDLAINSSVQYDIIAGNDEQYFEIDPNNGTLFLIREVDRESLTSSRFDLQVRARQTDDLTKMGLASVEIEVLDLNDNLPQFEVDLYNISIMENLPNGFSVLHILASDADQGENAEFEYKLEDKTKAFQIDPKTGWLTVQDQSQLDREKTASIVLRVVADEKTPNVAFGTSKSFAIVEVYLLDANDANPTFIPSNLYKFQVTIDSEIGSVVGQVQAEDPDLGGNGEIVYEIQKPNSTNDELPFDIDPKNGYIFLLERPLPKLQYTLLVEASDQPSNPSERRYSLAVVQIDVVKAGAAHTPEFIGSPYEFWVGTHVGVGTSVGQVKVNYLDPKYTVYDLLHSYYEGVPFAIEERTGIIAVVDELLKYSRTTYEFEAYVTDSRHTLTTNVTIHVVDPLESVSETRRDPLELTVMENVGGAVVANLRTLLKDSLRDVRATEFLLANYEARDKFAISADGTIYTLKPLDREEKSQHLLTVISQSRGIIQGQGVYEIHVKVLDENDNAPKFDRQIYEGHIRENSNPGTPVQMEYPIRVIDPDEGSHAEFRVELKGEGADRFRIDSKSGKIFVGNTALDREEKPQYNLKLVAIDRGNLTNTAQLNIFILDTNDNPPVFLQNIVLDPPDLDTSTGPRELLRSSASQPVSVEISHSEPIVIPETVAVGSRIARVLASDRDTGDNGKIFYRIVSENRNAIGEKITYLTDKQFLFSRNKEKHFMIDRATGEISVAKPLKPDTEYALNISASDRGGLRTHTGIRIIVRDVNDHAPTFEKPWYAFELLEGQYIRGEIGKVTAKDGDNGANGEVTYSLQLKHANESRLPFQIDPATGMIFVEGDIDRESRTKYSFSAVATDGGSPPMDSIVDVDVNILDINDNAPKFHGFVSVEEVRKGKVIPIYRASVKETITPGSFVTRVYANDSDSISNGNGLVLFHLGSHHREFHIDSKNGTITTLTHLDYDVQKEYNVTVVASDLGKPSLSSTSWVLVRVLSDRSEKNELQRRQDNDRMFNQEVYTFFIPHNFSTPYFLTRMNVTEKYKGYPTEFHLFGGEKIINSFRIGPKTGEIFVIQGLEHGVTYDMLVRGFNPQQPRGFDTRQNSQATDRYLEHNEALIRVELNSPPPPPLFPLYKSPPPRNRLLTSSSSTIASTELPVVVTQTNTTTTEAPTTRFPKYSSTTIFSRPVSTRASRRTTVSTTTTTTTTTSTTTTKAPPLLIMSSSDLTTSSSGEDSSTERPNSITESTKKSHHKHSYFLAGEIAVLTLSCIIFLGGLIAAVSVACIRKKRRHGGHPHGHGTGRPMSHISAIPVELRMPKTRGGIGNAPPRPLIFPMALPGEPPQTDSSDNTSETYTDTADVAPVQQRVTSHAARAAGLPTCPDCGKFRKPPGVPNPGGGPQNPQNNGFRGPSRSSRDNKGPGNKSRHPMEISLPSSTDSGIDGSDGQCTCCQSHNNNNNNPSSSNNAGDNGRSVHFLTQLFNNTEHFDDSLMPHPNDHRKPQVQKSFRKKQRGPGGQQPPYPPVPPPNNGRSNGPSSHGPSSFGNRMTDRFVIL